MIEFLMVFWI